MEEYFRKYLSDETRKTTLQLVEELLRDEDNGESDWLKGFDNQR